jgi:DMSO reductase anchor subunit
MHPAISVILLTTLIGAGQGLFLALAGVELAVARGAVAAPAAMGFYGMGSALAVMLLGAGLIASFFHLGHPERAWRAAAMWRTSWLSRECIVLPAFMVAVAAYGAAHVCAWPMTGWIAAAGAVLCVALFVCTAMIYACLKFLQEWHTPLTVLNYLLLGCASGLTLAAAFAAQTSPELAPALARWAIAVTVLALAGRAASLARNARLRPRSTVQSATGVKNPRLVQKSQGQMGGSFNTREFFHGRTAMWLRGVKWGFLLFAFVLPVLLLAGGWWAAAFVVQFLGLLAERWFFFAQAKHPQNLYYAAIS